MLKRMLMVLVAVFSLFALTACGERTYKADGVYAAFAESTNYGAPQITVVTVTIKNDKIESFYIDCLQSTAVKNEEDVVTGYNFNEKTKKELRYDYRMHGPGMDEEEYLDYLEENNKLEWFEQAELLEAYFKENGTDLTVDKDGYIQNVSGVSIVDSDYSKLAKKAVENAKAGKVYSWVATGGSTTNLIWAEGTVDKNGKLTSLKLDTRQGRITDGTFAWDEETKQEKGYDYRMHGPGMEEEAYLDYLEENNKLEWFEQADLLAAYVLENGLANVKYDDNGKLDNAPEAIAEVSVTVNHYVKVMKDLVDNWK
ncbi:MAG TPA: hypothetical protein GX692_07700 [Acholeplasmataceae bacterium]|nr:hypothetical protein [Acholeplasmataceae bacterium]